MLDLAAVIRIGPEFSPAEQDRARAAAARDPRLAVALEAAGYGLTQTLAAAPQLVARWEDAQTASPYAWAVLTAALDAARLGARAPLSADLLRAAAPGYCTSQQQAEAPDNWFEQALAYATGKLHGAAAALSPAGAGMGQVAGYTAADYLIQHASRERRYARVPASTWDAILSHIRDPADAARLADSARNRLLYRYAIPLYRHAADAGDENCRHARWPDLLAERGDLDELRSPARPGRRRRTHAVQQLAKLLAERGDLDGAAGPGRRRRLGRRRAAGRAAGRARGPGRSCAPGPTPATGTPPAAGRPAGRARRPGRGRADTARPGRRRRRMHAAWRLAELLADRGDLDGAARPGRRRRRTPPRGWPGCWPSAATWTELRARADAGDWAPPGGWPTCWPSAGTWTELRARADAGDGSAAARLARLLAERGELDGPVCAPGPTPATRAPPCSWPHC